MKLIYQGKNGEYIMGVPARDLEAHEVQAIAHEWGLSLAETEGLLIKRGLYAVAKETLTEETPPTTKTSKKVSK